LLVWPRHQELYSRQYTSWYHHQRGIDLLLDVIPTKNILFASEMIGAVRGIDPSTGHHYDDTKRYIDGNKALDAAAKQAIFEGNARRVFSRLSL
jgi:4-oxalmesaconate hydratase